MCLLSKVQRFLSAVSFFSYKVGDSSKAGKVIECNSDKWNVKYFYYGQRRDFK